MIGITNNHAKKLWQAEFERMMASLEIGISRDWNKAFIHQFFRASKFAKAGRFDDIPFIIDDVRLNLISMIKTHYRRIATVFSNKTFGVIQEKKFIEPTEIKSPKEDFWNEMNRWMTTEAADKVTKVSKTTKKILANVIHKGQQDKLSHVEIAKNIRKTGLIVNPHRARTIALTETHTAAVKSMDVSVKHTRIEMEREWVASKDMRTRRPDKNNIFDHYHDFPVGANGERVAQGQDFVGTGEPLQYPGDPKGSAGNVIRCLTNYGTPIYTQNGWKQVRHIIPGDLVLTHRNRFKPVLRINSDLYNGEVVRINLEGNKKWIVVTPEHPFLVSREEKRFSRWKEAKDIVVGDIVRFMASYCQWCGKPIPYYNSFCDKYCSGKVIGEARKNNPEFAEERRQVALKQWANPKHRKNMGKKASAQMKREYENGTRDRFEITKKARKKCVDKYGPGGSMAMLNKDPEFRKKHKKAIEKKYGSYSNMIKKFAFPALGKVNYGGSAIEKAMADFLTKNGKKFDAQFPVGRRRIDFYVRKEKLFIEVDGYPWHEDKERERKRDLEILSKYPDHKIAHVDYGPNPPKWEFFDLLGLNHTGTFSQIGMKVISVSKRQLKGTIRIYNFAVEDDESYIANGFVTHNCRCVLIYHPVNRMDQERVKPFAPLELEKWGWEGKNLEEMGDRLAEKYNIKLSEMIGYENEAQKIEALKDVGIEIDRVSQLIELQNEREVKLELHNSMSVRHPTLGKDKVTAFYDDRDLKNPKIVLSFDIRHGKIPKLNIGDMMVTSDRNSIFMHEYGHHIFDQQKLETRFKFNNIFKKLGEN